MMKLTKYGLKFENDREAKLAVDAVRGETRMSVKRSKSGLFFNNNMSREKAFKLLQNSFLFERI